MNTSTVPPIDAEVHDYLEAAPIEIRECREYGHMHRPTHEDFIIESDSEGREVWIKKLKCRSCGLPSTDHYTPWGRERIGSRRAHYSELPGYLAQGFRVSRADVRVFDAEKTMIRRRRRSLRRVS